MLPAKVDAPKGSPQKKIYATIEHKYSQPSISQRIEAFFLDNIGKVVTREQLIEIAKNPKTGKDPENWHQRLSELRTDKGYDILTHRDRSWLKIGEYLMTTPEKRTSQRRVYIDPATWQQVLKRASNACEWNEGGNTCGLKQGELDPVGGGTVRLTPDHKTPHSLGIPIDPKNPNEWQALCGRHQVVKKNYWDNVTGKLNILAILQAATGEEKRKAYEFLKNYFNE